MKKHETFPEVMETQNPAACHLLHLPREIRDQIYSDVLDTAGLDPPICPTETDYCIHEDQGWGCGYYQKPFPPISCLSLLLCNRLISSEVTEMITRKNNNKKTAFRYKLDLMIWDSDLQPTWLSLPVPLKYVKAVDVDIRFFRFGGSQWIDRSNVLAQYLLQLLRRFLTNGPAFIWSRSRPSSHCPPHLDNLSISFNSMLQKSASSSNNYQVLGFPGQYFAAEEFLTEEMYAYSRFSKYISIIANSGLLFGKIKSLQLRDDGTTWLTRSVCDDEISTKVYDVKNAGDVSLTEALFSGYGWGPVLEITQMILNNGGINYTDTLDCFPKDPNMPIEPKAYGHTRRCEVACVMH